MAARRTPKTKGADQVVSLKRAMPSEVRAAEAELARNGLPPQVTIRRPVKLARTKPVKLLPVSTTQQSQPSRITTIKSAPVVRNMEEEKAALIKRVGDRPILWKSIDMITERIATVVKAAIGARVEPLTKKVIALEAEISVLKFQLAKAKNVPGSRTK